ncbi:hypothetical protein DID80_05365 [Candidatus Marinamargulisbacteria bacterium SCGC AAA071-K20]|nr:hypothetical protein DID80_05365 [Candidatus Marinamargulisbacteria bacterium SCGC AAA071-K20]
MPAKTAPVIGLTEQIKNNLVAKIKDNVSQLTLDSTIHKVSLEMPKLNLVRWLKNQEESTQFYYEDHTNKSQLACIGKLKEMKVNSLENSLLSSVGKTIDTQEGITYIASITCLDNNKEDAVWGKETSLFYIPFLQIDQSEKNTILNCYFELSSNKEQIIQNLFDKLQSITFSDTLTHFSDNICIIKSESTCPNNEEWRQKVDTVKECIKNKTVEKVVLSRRVDITCSKKVDVYRGLESLRSHRTKGVTFLRKINQKTTFIGSTPEILFSRERNKIKSMALAGTSKKESESTDKLLKDPKEVHEHGFVKNGLNHS